MGRELFIQKVMDWRHEKGDKIFQQLRKMGASLDWSQTQFTMSKVRFIKMKSYQKFHIERWRSMYKHQNLLKSRH